MWLTLTHEGRRVRVAVARAPTGVWVGYAGGAVLVPRRDRSRAAAAGPAGGGTGEVRAPMTGRVVQVTAQVGDKVDEGTTLVVLEAMKMEYRLRAPHKAEVASMHCKAGDLVDLGVLLVTLKP